MSNNIFVNICKVSLLNKRTTNKSSDVSLHELRQELFFLAGFPFPHHARRSCVADEASLHLKMLHACVVAIQHFHRSPSAERKRDGSVRRLAVLFFALAGIRTKEAHWKARACPSVLPSFSHGSRHHCFELCLLLGEIKVGEMVRNNSSYRGGGGRGGHYRHHNSYYNNQHQQGEEQQQQHSRQNYGYNRRRYHDRGGFHRHQQQHWQQQQRQQPALMSDQGPIDPNQTYIMSGALLKQP